MGHQTKISNFIAKPDKSLSTCIGAGVSDIIIIDDSDQEAGVRKLVEEVQEDITCYSVSGCFDNTVGEEQGENTTNTPNSSVDESCNH